MVEVSVVMPCLNEERTVGICVGKAIAALNRLGIRGEVIVSDNGSTDRSVQIAESAGARVVFQPKRGYGAAYQKGLEEAKGRYMVIGDSDNTYDFTDIGRFIAPLKQGYDFVIGNRFGGGIMPGAMSLLHMHLGNPLLSMFLRLLYSSRITDAHCGMRAFTREAYKKMRLSSAGMEFASEMVIKAAKAGLRTKEIPIRYYARVSGSKLRTIKDGWRHTRFMLMHSPTHLFLIPGWFLFFAGLLLLIILYQFDRLNSMMLGSMLVILGYNIVLLGFFARTYAIVHLKEKDRLVGKIISNVTLEKGVAAGVLLFLTGIILGFGIIFKWLNEGINLNEVKLSIIIMTLIAIGIQTIFFSFFLSILSIKGENLK